MRRGHHHAQRARPEAARRSPLCGFSHTMRWHSRDSRSIAVASTAGSPRSRPSEQITTIPPRPTPRRPQSRTKASQRVADPGPALPVEDGPGRPFQRLVGTAVLELAGDPGQPGAEAEDLDPGRGPAWWSARTGAGCASSRPSSPTRPGSGPAAAAGAGGAARTARPARRACASSRAPCGAGRALRPRDRAPIVRRLRRRGGVSRIGAMIRRRAASSSGVQAANDLLLQRRRRPRRSGRARPRGPGAPARARSRGPAGPPRSRPWPGSSAGPARGARPPRPRKNRRNTRSYDGDLVVPGHHRGPPGPVEVDAGRSGPAGPSPSSTSARRRSPTGSPAERSSRAKSTSRRDERGVVRHRRRSPPGCPAPGRGRRAP